MSTNDKNSPASKIQHGLIEAAIWKNFGEKRDFYRVTFSRNWKSSNSFSGNDMLILQKVADEASI